MSNINDSNINDIVKEDLSADKGNSNESSFFQQANVQKDDLSDIEIKTVDRADDNAKAGWTVNWNTGWTKATC